MVNLLDIEIVVIGGGLVSAGELLLAPTRDSFRGLLFGRSRRPLPALVPARFGPGAGVVGAATLALEQRDLHQSALTGLPCSQDAASAADQHLLPPVRQGAPLGATHRGRQEIPAPGPPQPSSAHLAGRQRWCRGNDPYPYTAGRDL